MHPPDSPVVQRFVRYSNVARVATCSPAGNPDIIPLHVVTWRGRYYVSLRADNPIARDVRHSGEALLLFHAERARHNGWVLRIRGSASFHTGRSKTLVPALLSARKHLLTPGGLANALKNRRRWSARNRYVRERAGETGVIEVIPESAEFVRLA